MKRVVSLMIAVIMSIYIVAPCTYADDTYVYIQSAADLKDFANNCAIDSYSEGKTAVLKSDIDVSNVDFNGILYLNGVLDGGGYTVSGVKLNVSNPERGFIGTIGENGEVRNLTVSAEINEKEENKSDNTIDNSRMLKIIENLSDDDENNAIDRFVSKSGVHSVGGIAGVNKGRINGCHFKGTLNITKNAGGIAGVNEGLIEMSSNEGSVTSEENTGGIAGKNSGVIKWSSNYGRINDAAVEDMYATGGIAGKSDGIVESSNNHATVGYKNAGMATGGIVGVQSGNVNDCLNDGTVYGKKRVGGIVGNFEPYINILYNRDEWSDRIDEQKDKLRSDLDSIEDRIDKNRNKIKDDLDNWDSRIRNTLGLDSIDKVADSLTDLNGTISDQIGGSKISDIVDSIKDLNESISSKVTNSNSLSDAVNSLDRAVSILHDAQKDLSDGNGSVIDFLNQSRDTAAHMSDVSEKLSNSLTESNDHIMELIDSVNDSVNDEDRKNRVNKALDSVNDALDSTSKALDAMSKWDLDFGDIDMPDINIDILDHVDTELSRILRVIYNNMKTLEEPFQTITDSFKDLIKNLQERKTKLEEIKKKLEDELNKILPTRKPTETPTTLPIETQKTSARGFFTTAYAADDNEDITKKLLDLDISDIDIPLTETIQGYERDMALVQYCVNDGDVSGLVDIGGISGGVGFEFGINNNSITTSGETFSLNPSTGIKSVIEGCINEGKISAKSNSAGGVTGFSNLGKIKDSINSGDIEVTDGSYAGGISGYNLNDITRCINTGDVDAQSDIGGIAGYGKNISQTYALTRTHSDAERVGAIAGTATGNLEHNYFLKEKLGGINSVNYNDKAQPVEKDTLARDGEIAPELSGLESGYWTAVSGEKYMPQLRAFTENNAATMSEMLKAISAGCARFVFTADFVVDGQSVKSVNLQYGELLNKSDIPEIPKVNGQYGEWDHNVEEPIIRNTKFTAVYNKSTTALSYGGEPPQILVEGDFSPSATLTVNEFNPAAIVNDKKYDPIGGYEINVTEGENKYEGTLQVHVRVPKDKGNYKIGLVTERSIVIADAETDGSYLVFSPNGAERFIVLDQKPSKTIYYISGIAIFIILALLFTFRQRIKERRLLNKLKEIKTNVKLLPKITMALDDDFDEEKEINALEGPHEDAEVEDTEVKGDREKETDNNVRAGEKEKS